MAITLTEVNNGAKDEKGYYKYFNWVVDHC